MRVSNRTRLFVAMLIPALAGAVALDLVLRRAADRDTRAEADAALDRLMGAAEAALRAHGTDADLQDLAGTLGRATGLRVTIVAPAGKVLADSDVAPGEVPSLPDHGHRPEIRDALSTGEGRAVRYSDTLHAPLSYRARHLPDVAGGVVLRLAWPLYEQARRTEARREAILAAVAGSVVVAALVAFAVAALVARRTRRLADAALRMAAGDLDVRVRIEPGDDEVARVGRALNQLADATRDTIRRLDEEGRLVRTILESMREGVMALDGSGRVTLVNQAMIDTCAFPPGALGRPAAELIRAPEVLQAVAEAADGRAVSREVHVALPRPATLLVNASPLREGGALLVVHDTTELHRLHQVRRDFVANVSHELRNPVATIQAAVETLADLRPDPDPDERRLLETVTRQSARMAALVRDLLSLARIESGQLELHPRALDLGQELQALVSPFDAPARAKELELVVEPAPGTPPVLADPEALQTVLGNLVDNAVKYARPGDRVLVRVRPGEPGWVEIEVSDTGPGIDAIHLPRLFERFYRVDAGRSREVGGTGLGLALVKHLAAAMGGKVQVRSTPGRGATFTVTLPAAG